MKINGKDDTIELNREQLVKVEAFTYLRSVICNKERVEKDTGKENKQKKSNISKVGSDL